MPDTFTLMGEGAEKPVTLITVSPPRRYRCPNGHEMTNELGGEFYSLVVGVGSTTKLVRMCLVCALEWLEKQVPLLEEVTDG